MKKTAVEKEWTISHLVENILQEWAKKKEPPGKTGGSSYAGIALSFSRNT